MFKPSYALILVLLTLLTGLIYLLDRFFWAKHRSKGQQPNKLIEYSRSFFPVLLIVLLFRSFFIEPFRIPSGSLEPTLNVGDFVAVSKFSYGLRLPVLETKIIPFKEPKHGDIAVFRWPPNPEFDYIKRVVGLPGDKVAYHNKVLTINGQEAKQHFVDYTVDESSGQAVSRYRENIAGVEHDIYLRPQAKAVDFEIQVPEGQYFMMGDNRDDSADSRYWGFVDESYLRGKAFMVWLSWDSQQGKLRWKNMAKFIH